MHYYLNAQFRLISLADDDLPALEALFWKYIPMDEETKKKEKVKVVSDPFIDSYHQKRYLITMSLDKQKHVTAFVKNLFSSFSKDQLMTLDKQAETRVDDECHFYIRLDKEPLLKNELVITDSGDCFHITLTVASYPHKQSVAIQTVKKYLNELITKPFHE
jgi:RNA binding exosome subunit